MGSKIKKNTRRKLVRDKRNSLLSIIVIGLTFPIASLLFYSYWTPGKDIRDGRHDLRTNGIWIQHGWLGDDKWFVTNHKEDKITYFRDPVKIQRLASLLKAHNISDVYPHLCPTASTGKVPYVDPKQTDLFLEVFDGFRIMPWIGGVLGVQAFPGRREWRKSFTDSIRKLLIRYPKFSGVHINIEPCKSGDKDFLLLLDEVRSVIPKGKILSVAAFPPQTILHPFEDVHWDKDYYKKVSKRVDQIVVMMYDTALFAEKIYQYLMVRWTQEILDWADGTDVLLGLPAYNDKGLAYHNPMVENLKNSLLGIHQGLSKFNSLPKNYRGVSIYCEWEMDNGTWKTLEDHFLKYTMLTRSTIWTRQE